MRISDWSSDVCSSDLIAAEGEDRRRGVQRAQPAEGRPFKMHVEQREGELQRDEDAGGEGGDPPEGRGDHEGADDLHDIGGSGGGAAARKSVGEGKREAGRVDRGGGRSFKKEQESKTDMRDANRQ